MPDQAKPPADDDRYQTDTFSRGDAEGMPVADPGGPDELAEDERPIEAGAAGGYQTDAFSRGDAEGVPQADLRRRPTDPASDTPPQSEAAPQGTHLKAVDDADSRDAPPMTGPEGGVR
jgi:hypothetical protein